MKVTRMNCEIALKENMKIGTIEAESKRNPVENMQNNKSPDQNQPKKKEKHNSERLTRMKT